MDTVLRASAIEPRGFRNPHSGDHAPAETLESRVDEWIRQPEIGLRFDPFRERDAGHDSRLPLYLVDHGAFAALWGDWPSIVFAPAGGGKTAFRVRLTHACRVGEDGRRVFPLTLTSLPLSDLFESLNQAATAELLLHLIYAPSRFMTLDKANQGKIRRILEENLAESLGNRLQQIEDLLERIGNGGNWDLLAETFDPAAQGLFTPPTHSEVKELVRALLLFPSSLTTERVSPESRFEQVYDFLKSLGYEAVYLLVDGVDAYLETQREPDAALEVLQPLLERTQIWADKRVYLKYFLPIELQEPLFARAPDLLTNGRYFAIIKWTPEALCEVVSQRLQAASGEYRAINSLDALSTPALRGAEDELLRVARPLPRDLVMLVEQMFIEHVRRQGPQGRLEPEDLDAAVQWYQRLGGTGSS